MLRRNQGGIAMTFVLAMAGLAAAQNDVCIPVTATPPVIDGVLAGDPGWEGSARIDLDVSGVAPTTYLRLCRTTGDQPKIYVGLRVETGTVSPTMFDRIVLGLRPMDVDDAQADLHAWRIHIDPFSQRNDAGTYSPGGVQFWQNAGSWNQSSTGTDPSQILTGHWLQKENMKITAGIDGTWGFEMVLTLNSDAATASGNGGVYVPGSGTFKLYFDLVKLEGNGFANQYSWPKNLPVSPTLTSGTPTPDTWGNGSYATTAFCTVGLTYDKIGTYIPPSLKNYMIAVYSPMTDSDCASIVDADHVGQMGPTNVIYAKPRNRMPAIANLRLTFSVANWGIPAPSDWFTVAYPGAQCPPLTQLQNPTAWTTINPGMTKTMTMEWPLTYRQTCEQGAVLQKSIKVDLEGKPDTKFMESTVVRAVTPGLASAFRHDARIGTAGYPPSAGGIERMLMVVRKEVHPRYVPPPPPPQKAPLPNRLAAAVAGVPPVPDSDVYVPAEAFAASEFGPEIREAMTWTCRGYLKTGKKLTIDDRPQKVTVEQLRAIGGFEYVVGHEGDAESWSSTFTGAGLRPLGQGIFDLEVPSGQVGLVHTWIEAEDFHRWAFGVRVGFVLPHGDVAKSYDGGLAETAILEYRFAPHLSFEGRFGYAHFDGESGVPDAGVVSNSVDVKTTFLTGDLQPFINAGFGYYVATPGRGNAGANIGGGLRWRMSDLVGLDASYDYHEVFATGADPRYSTIQVGVDLRF